MSRYASISCYVSGRISRFLLHAVSFPMFSLLIVCLSFFFCFLYVRFVRSCFFAVLPCSCCTASAHSTLLHSCGCLQFSTVCRILLQQLVFYFTFHDRRIEISVSTVIGHDQIIPWRDPGFFVHAQLPSVMFHIARIVDQSAVLPIV